MLLFHGETYLHIHVKIRPMRCIQTYYKFYVNISILAQVFDKIKLSFYWISPIDQLMVQIKIILTISEKWH